MQARRLAEQLNKYALSFKNAAWRKYTSKHDCIHKEHIVTCYSLHIVTGGRGSYVLDNIRHEVKAGKLFAFVPGIRFEGFSDPRHPLKMYSIRYSVSLVGGSVEDEPAEPFPLAGKYNLLREQHIHDLAERICGYFDKIDEIGMLYQKSLFHHTLYAIVEDLHLQETQSSTAMLIEETFEYLKRHYKENVSVDQLAGMIGLSTSHFSKLFKEKIGYSPKDYLIRLRINRAKQFLEFSDCHLKDVAQKVGYPDEFYFSRIFKKIVGVSPSQFAKQSEGMR